MLCDDLSAGSPFGFTVADPERVCASGDGLDMVRAGKMACFVISAPAARSCDLSVKILGRICIYEYVYSHIYTMVQKRHSVPLYYFVTNTVKKN